MAAVTFSGLSSGLDSDAIVRSLVEVERIPILRLQQQNSFNQAKISVIDRLSSALSSLRTAAKDLDTAGEFLSFTGKSSNSDALGVTTSGDAVPGTYQVEITQIASAQRTYSTTFADPTAELSASDQTLDIVIDGETTSIDVAAGSTLEDLVGAINGSGADVTAGLIFDGSEYRLQVAGNSVGADNAFSFVDSGLGLGLDTIDTTAGTGNTPQQALDAEVEIDGLFTVTSTDNLLDDVIPGTILELKEATVGEPFNVSVAADPSSVNGKLKTFVDAYNSVMSIINAQVGEGKNQATLNGDSTVRTIEQALGRLISSPIPGLETADGDSMQLADLGIKTQSDGTLTLDTEKLDETLANGFQSAAQYFAGDPEADIDGMGQLIDDLIDSYTDSVDGLLTTRKGGITALIKNNDSRIEDLEDLLGGFETRLRNQFTALEGTMSALQSQQSFLAQFVQRL